MKYCFFKDGTRFSIPVYNLQYDKECDILVAGLGTAGSMAAICASRLGANVIGVEEQNVMGGIATRGAVNTYYYGSRGGTFEEINQKCIELTANSHYADSAVDNNIQMSISPCVKAYVLEREAKNAGCTLLLGATLIGVYMDDEEKNVMGANVLKDGKQISIKSSYIIDSTRNTAACMASGTLFLPGRPWDGRLMMYSKGVSTVSDERPNLDNAQWFKYDFKHLPLNIGRSLVQLSWVNDRYLDPKNPYKSSKALLESNAGQPFMMPSYDEKTKIVSLASALGTRETYEVETETVYTFDDFSKNVPTKDVLYYTFAPLDTTSPDPAFEADDLNDWRILCDTDAGFSVGISRGCLIPKGIGGLAVACRGIGVGHTLCGAVRMKADMEKCGEAAGTMCALAIQNNCDVRDVDYTLLRDTLSKTGCYNESQNKGFTGTEVSLFYPPSEVKFATCQSDVKEALSSYETAGLAIWPIRGGWVSKDVYTLLPIWFEEEYKKHCKSPLCYNLAVCLALTGDNRGVHLFAEDLCCREDLKQLTKSVYLCGKFSAVQAIPTLKELIYGFVNDGLYSFRVASYSAIALLRIYLTDKEKYTGIPKFLEENLKDERFHLEELKNFWQSKG